MPEQEFNAIFSKRLKFYLNKINMTQADFAKKMGVGTTSVYNWCNGIKTPRMDKVDAMCDLFKCKRSDLMDESSDTPPTPYYLNDETRQIAQEAFENPELRTLFKAARDLPPERLKAHIAFIESLKEQEKNNNDEGC